MVLIGVGVVEGSVVDLVVIDVELVEGRRVELVVVELPVVVSQYRQETGQNILINSGEFAHSP